MLSSSTRRLVGWTSSDSTLGGLIASLLSLLIISLSRFGSIRDDYSEVFFCLNRSWSWLERQPITISNHWK
jgi:hypothetical protein